jgi:hypothetical protein
MEHARRNGFATEALMPLGGKPERLLPPIAKQPQNVIRDFGSDFSFPSHVLLYFTFMQTTRYIVVHTRDSISQHHQRNSYTHHQLRLISQHTCPFPTGR